MGLFDFFKKKSHKHQNHYEIGLRSSSGEKGNIIVDTGYLPNIISTLTDIGHYEFCVIGNNMLEYSLRLNFTTIRVYTGLKEATTAMKAEAERLESVGYKNEINTLSNSHNKKRLALELTKKQSEPKVEKVTGDICANAGYKPFVIMQVIEGLDAQYIYLVKNAFIIYEIGKYNTSHIRTYRTEDLAGQGLTDYINKTKSMGFTNIIDEESIIHNAMIQSGISV